MAGVKISPKHGVNPTLPVCFFCGKETGEIALLGKINKQDDEAPKNMVLNYEPCEKCKKSMALGATLIGVTSKQPQDHRMPISIENGTELYPTGSWMVITKEAAQRYFAEVATSEEIEKSERILVEQEFIDFLNDQMKQLEMNEQE